MGLNAQLRTIARMWQVDVDLKDGAEMGANESSNSLNHEPVCHDL
jgi:hypothetical protein